MEESKIMQAMHYIVCLPDSIIVGVVFAVVVVITIECPLTIVLLVASRAMV